MRAVGGGSVLSLAGCAEPTASTEESDPTFAGESLTLATATTAADSGLLDAVHPAFERGFGVSVDTVVRGTGGALETARNGDCDVVIVHARPLEDEFLRAGDGINRRSLMVNDFLVVGPPDDPAGSWYGETGQGMGNTLVTAGQTGSYTLTDRGTYRNVASEDRLAPHVDRGIDDPPPLLRNEYAAIPVNPARHDVSYTLAMAYLGYLTGPARERIGAFRVDGEPAFRPLGAAEEPEFEQYVPSGWPG